MIGTVVASLLGSRIGRWLAVTLLIVVSAWLTYRSVLAQGRREGAQAIRLEQQAAALESFAARVKSDAELAAKPRAERLREYERWISD